MFPTPYHVLAITGTLLFTGILPALPVYLMMRNKQISDTFLSKQEERTMPYLFTMLGDIFWVLFLWRNLMFPIDFVLVAAGSVLCIIVTMFINLKWKISAHMGAMGGLVGGICAVSYISAINPVGVIILAIIFSGLVGISRLYLKAHSLSQVLWGFALGLFSVILPPFIYYFFFHH
jgi:membrane-associated phospholipid phosphatase